jgi:3-isopropylmalate/(R)-2-methylmalate dehydratase small subunit
VVSEKAQDQLNDGEKVEMDFNKNEIVTKSKRIAFNPLPESVQKILDAGGLIPYTKQKIMNGK